VRASQNLETPELIDCEVGLLVMNYKFPSITRVI